jgi:colanic acid biosynthesis glycosyl transferase WcaI
MAAGRPIVLSGAGEAARFVIDRGAGVVVPPADPDALAQALADLASDRQRAAALGAAGHRWVESHHGRAGSVQRWLELLEEVA